MERNYLKSLSIYYTGREKCKPGYAFGPAIRQHYLLHIILEGKGTYHKNGKIYELKKGDAFLIIPGEKSYYKADKDEPWEYAWVGFDGYEVPKIMADCHLSTEHPIFRDGEEEPFMKVIKELVEHYEGNEPNEYKVIAFTYLLFAYMSKETEYMNCNSYEKEYLQRAKEYVQQNYEWNIKVSDIAKAVGIDRSYLYRLFMREEECSPKEYLTEMRLQAAMYMLANGKQDIMEIAMACGFRDSSSFCKIFKKRYHKTPRRFRMEQHANHLEPGESDSEDTFVLP